MSQHSRIDEPFEEPRSPGDGGDGGGHDRLEPIDLLLQQGTSAELADFRSRVAADPLLALDLADTVALLERLRTVRVEPNPAFSGKLADVVRRADRRMQPQHRFTPWLAAAAIAIVTFGFVTWVDPLDLRVERTAVRDTEIGRRTDIAQPLGDSTAFGSATPGSAAAAARSTNVAEDTPHDGGAEANGTRSVGDLAYEEALGAMRRRFDVEAATQLRDALDHAIAEQTAGADTLSRWLDPRNALAVLVRDHELRARTEVRHAAMRRHGGMVATDERVQALADTLALEIGATPGAAGRFRAHQIAVAVRAIVAAGASTPARRLAVERGVDRLVQRLPELVGARRVDVLAALVEAAAVERIGVVGIRRSGESLVAEVMRVDEETWQRRRPDLLTSRVPAATIGSAGRALALLPAFGVTSERCAFVRRLLLGQLRERRDQLQEPDPALFAAMLYGYSDLLDGDDRDDLVRQLRRWKPVHLAPDFRTVQQMAWGVRPGQLGFTRLQCDLRALVALPDPDSMPQRALLCLCLATSYAAGRDGSLERFVPGE
ncbi:MAG: hypothetical protein NXI31_18525 [bacterium]|nr:hypothetical protein [bacterium]